MSSGKKRVVKQPVPVQVTGGTPPPLTSATPTSQAARAFVKSPAQPVPSQPKAKAPSTTSPPVKSSNPPKAAQHPPVVVASQPLVTAQKPAVALDDFPPLPSKTGSISPATPKQSNPASADTSPSLSSSQPPAQPSRNLSDTAAAMISSNAQTRASKTQQLRETLKKVQGRDDEGVVVQGEESRAKGGRPAPAHRREGSAGVNPPASPAGEVLSPLDASTSFSGAGYSPIHRRANQTKDETDLLDDTDLDMDDTADGGGKASNHSSSTTSPALPSKGSNRSFSNRAAAAGTFTASTQVQAGGLSEKELQAILAVAEDPSNRGDAVSKAAYINVCRHLVRLQSVMNEREADLRMAGELGEAICAENGKLEAIVEELTHSLDAQVEEMKRLEESKSQLERRVEELSASNHQLISEKMARQVDTELNEEEEGDKGRRKKGREDSASTAVTEFIRGELATNLLNTSLDQSFDSTGASLAPVPASPSSKPIKYTGNLILDVQNLQRKLRRERKMWDRNLQTMEAALQTKEKERAQLAADNLRLEQEMETFRELQSQLLKKNSEWEEKEEALREREERLQHDTKMKLSTQRKSLEMEVQGREEELRREKEDRAKEGKRRAELEAQVRELQVRIDELNHQLELWSEEKTRVQAALEGERRQVQTLAAELKQAKEEAQKKGKQVKAAEKIVGQSEHGRETEERRARDTEQRLAQEERRAQEAGHKLAEAERRAVDIEGRLSQEESRRAEEERRRMAAEAELQKTQAAVTQLKEQMRRDRMVAAEKGGEKGQSVITAEAGATLATPHAAPKKDSATQSESKEVTTVGTAAALASPTGASGFPAPMWVLPAPSFSVNVKDQALLTAMFSYLVHQWTIALLLLVSNSRVKKTVEWIKDTQSSECLSCHKEFGLLFNRRHHCRLCGGLYCADCANLTVDLDKFGLEDVRVCSACFNVVGVMTHGQSLMVQRTKVSQKVKEGKAKLKKAKDSPAPIAPPARLPEAAPKKAAKTPVAIAAPAPSPSRPTTSSSVASTPSAEPSIVSGTPRLKKAKSIAPSTAPTAAAAPALALRSPVVTSNGSATADSGVVISAPVRSAAPSAPLPIMAPVVPALTYTPSPSSKQGPLVTGQVSAPVQKAVPVSVVSGGPVVTEGGEVVLPVKKKIVKKVVKKVKPVALAPSQ